MAEQQGVVMGGLDLLGDDETEEEDSTGSFDNAASAKAIDGNGANHSPKNEKIATLNDRLTKMQISFTKQLSATNEAFDSKTAENSAALIKSYLSLKESYKALGASLTVFEMEMADVEEDNDALEATVAELVARNLELENMVQALSSQLGN